MSKKFYRIPKVVNYQGNEVKAEFLFMLRGVYQRTSIGKVLSCINQDNIYNAE